ELLRFPLTMFPEMISSIVLASVSIKRLDRFFNSEQLEKYVSRENSNSAIHMENGTFAWSAAKSEDHGENNKPEEEEKLVSNGNTNGSSRITLKAVNLKVPKGSLVAI